MSCRKKTLYFHHENRKRTTVRFFNGFNDIVFIHRPSVAKVTVKRLFFDRFQTQKGFELLPDSAQILYRRLLIHHSRPKTDINLIKIAELTGLCDADEVNLKNTVEKNIL
jgi:hypothetical protein